MLAGPQLVNVAPNTGGFLANGQLRTEAPRELVFTFSPGSSIDPTTLDGIEVTRAGADGTLGSFDDVIVQQGFIGVEPLSNQVTLRFADSLVDDLYRVQVTGTLADLSGDAFNDGETETIDFRIDFGGQVVSVVPQPVLRATVLSIDDSSLITSGDTVTVGGGSTPVTFEFRLADQPQLLAAGNTFVDYQAGDSAGTLAAKLGAALEAASNDADSPLYKRIRVNVVGSQIEVGGVEFSPRVTRSVVNAGFLSAANGALSQARDTIVVYFNENPLNPTLAEDASFYQVIDVQNGSLLLPQTVRYDEVSHTAVLQFSDNLPAGTFHLQIGAPNLRNNTLARAVNVGTLFGNTGTFVTVGYLGDSVGSNQAFNEFDLFAFRTGDSQTTVNILATEITNNLGGEVLLRLFDAAGNEVLLGNGVNILSVTGLAANSQYYVGVSSVGNFAYDPVTGNNATGGTGTGSYKLSLSSSAALLQNNDTSSFGTSTTLGVLGAGGFQISGTITNPGGLAIPPLPGGNDEPGHRELPFAGESNDAFSGQTPRVPGAISTRFYNFPTIYGTDPQGNDLFNAITDAQKQRAREIFEMYGRYLGLEFVETDDGGAADFNIVTGDPRAVSPTVPPGSVGGIQGGSLVVMNATIDWGVSEYGGGWFFTAFHEIGHALGLDHSYDAPSTMGQGLTGVEPVYPGDINLVPAMRQTPPASTDVNLYRFDLAQNGTLTAETIAQRLAQASNPNLQSAQDVATPSLLDSLLTLYRETYVAASITSDFGTQGAARLKFVARTAGSEGNGIQLVVTKADLGSGVGPAISVNSSRIDIVLNTNAGGRTTAQGLVDAINNNAEAKLLVQASLDSGNGTTDLATPTVNYSPLTLSGGATNRTIVARNDDYFGRDSLLNLHLDAGTYYIAVSSTGNSSFDPSVAGTGFGGRTDGEYQLNLSFVADPVADQTLNDVRGVAFDGDIDRVTGGTFEYWFQVGNTIFVDKANASDLTQDGSVEHPYSSVATALAAVGQVIVPTGVEGTIIRIVGNGGADADILTPDDNLAYLFGYDSSGAAVEDGSEFIVPQGVTVMIDEGAILKLNSAIIDVGKSVVNIDRSGAALQVLGTPGNQVQFTSLGNDNLGGRSDSNDFNGPERGDWGGIVFRQFSDFQGVDWRGRGVFLNSVNQANLTYGGGQVEDDSVGQVFTPIHIENLDADRGLYARPNIWFNTISQSADAAVSADPNSFANTGDRSGPTVRGNRIEDNTINAFFIRVRTNFGNPIDTLQLPARIDDIDITYVLPENLYIDGSAGGPFLSGDGVWDARLSASLVLDPGVILKLSGARIQTQIGSSQFVAEGTSTLPVVLTSLRDDSYGAGGSFDTGSDGAAPASRGDWAGLSFSPNSSGSLDHVVLQYAGGTAANNGAFAGFNPVEILQADVRITNSVFRLNADGTPGGDREGLLSNGSATVFVRGAQPVIVGNTFQSNTGNAISINANSLSSLEVKDWGRSTGTSDAFTTLLNNTGPLVVNNSMAGNGTNGMEVRGERITTETIWDDADIVHVLRTEIVEDINRHTYGGIRLQSSPESSLVVKLSGANAGFTVGGTPEEIDDRIGGTLQVIGSAQFPVVLTSLDDDTVGAGFRPDGLPQNDTDGDGNLTSPQPGQWRGLRLQSYSNDRNAAVVLEGETPNNTAEQNGTPATAQFLGSLAPQLASDNAMNKKGGNDYQPYAYEVHGFLQNPTDIDTYSFTANRGTEVWFDISRTSQSLDSVVELVDSNGTVLASSNDSQFSTQGGTALPLIKDPKLGGDYYTSNPRDAGMRVVLTGASAVNTYFVRVRSQGGLTAGQYNLQTRIRQVYEAPGSTIRNADIRYATNGIEILGLPGRSPLSGEAAEVPGSSFGTPTNLGNLLASDMSTLSVSGNLDSASQVDWYQFRLQYDLIQSIGGVNGAGKTWSSIFDIDYADGLVRPDAIISVFNSAGELILVSRDSNISDDQPGPQQGNGLTDLSRGSVGKLDPYIGSVQMPAGTPSTSGFNYFVAISSNAQLPSAMNATFASNSGNGLVRLEPVSSVRRIVEDHIGFIGHTTGNPNVGVTSTATPYTPAILPVETLAQLQTSVTPLQLRDLTLYSANGNTLSALNPSSGATLYSHPSSISGVGFNGSIKMRSDGVLYGYRATVPAAANNAGTLVIINTQTGAETVVGVDAIPDFNAGTNPPDPNQLTSDAVDSLAFIRAGDDGAGATSYELYYAVRDRDGQYNANSPASRLYRADPGSGSAAASGDLGVKGEIVRFVGDTQIGLTTGMASIGGQLFGVSSSGMFYRINRFTGGATLIRDFGTPFTSLTEGPQNLNNGAFANLLFATTEAGNLICFNTAGVQQGVFQGGASSVSIGATQGISFSPLDFNLWHPTELRGSNAGHGINAAFDQSRNHAGDVEQPLGASRTTNEASGGGSFYFGLETWATDPDAADRYLTYGPNAQYGATRDAHFDLSSNPAIGDNYNLPGGAMGSLVTNSFSLVGYQSTDKPTLYFNYFLATEGVDSRTAMRDSARVFATTDNGTTWRLLATNNSVPSDPATANSELPSFSSASRAINSSAENQRVQELFDNTGGWRQARIDLADFVGNAAIRLRFDYSTAGAALAGSATQGITGDAFGVGPNDVRRAQNNTAEGFYIDDIIVGLAERGEMVTGTQANTGFFAVPTNPNTAAPTQSLVGAYQLEIRRGEDYGANTQRSSSDVVVNQQYDSNDRMAPGITLTSLAGNQITDGQTFTVTDGLNSVTFEFDRNSVSGSNNVRVGYSTSQSAATVATAIRNAINSAAQAGRFRVTAHLADDNITASNSSNSIQIDLVNAVSVVGYPGTSASYNRRGDRNTIRDQGQIQIYGNSVSNVSGIGIRFDSQRDAGTNLPRPGAAINTPTLNAQRLLPAANISNNVVFNFGQAGISFEGSGSTTPLGSVPFGRIVNNTIYGGVTATGVGISVADNAGPTIMNNIVANTVTGISVDSSSRATTVIDATVFQRNTTNVTSGVSNTNTIALTPSNPLFVSPSTGNFYLAANSRAIDSSRNSLTERSAVASVKSPLGIPVSPIIAPANDRYGQLRVDDPAVPNATGLGANIFIDRGAIERADFFRPRARLTTPLDNATGIDGNPALDTVFITSATRLTQIVLQLSDQGVGIDHATVVSSAFVLRQNGVALVDGVDYQFVYNRNTRQVYFQSVSEFPLQSSYAITVDTSVVKDLAGNLLQGNQSDGSAVFTIIGNAPPRLTEVDTFDGLKNIAIDISYAQLLAASDLLVVSGHGQLFQISSVLLGTLEILKQGALNKVPATPGTLVEPGDVLTWTPPTDRVGLTGAFAIVGYDPENALIAPELAVSSPPVTVNVDLVDKAPTLTTIDTLDGATEDTGFKITHQTLVDASDVADENNDPISFRIATILSGSLQVVIGNNPPVDVVEGVTLIGPNDSLIWTPPSNENNELNGGPLSAFSVVAFDGTNNSSPEISVQVNVDPVPDAPILTTVETLSLGGLNSRFKILFETLLGASDSQNVDGHTNEFRIASIPQGATLQIRKAATPTQTDPVTAGQTIVSPGDVLIWTPATGVSGPAVEAFRVVAYDSFNAQNFPSSTPQVVVSSPDVAVTVEVLDEIAPVLTEVDTLQRPRYVASTITYQNLVDASDLDFQPGNTVAFRIENIDQGTLLINGLPAVSGSLVLPGDVLTWNLTTATGLQDAFDLSAVDQDNTLTSLDPVQVRVNLVNVAPTLTTISTLSIAEQQTAFGISHAKLLASSNAADLNSDTISFRIESISSNGTLQITTSGGTTTAVVGTIVNPGDTLTWTPGVGVIGTAVQAFTVKAFDGELASADPAVPVNVYVRAWGSEFSLSGIWTINGRLARVNQTGTNITFVNENGVGSPGRFIARDQVTADAYGLTAKIDLTAADQGRLIFSNGVIWLRISLGGQWVVNNRLASVQQLNDVQLMLTNGLGQSSNGAILTAGTLVATNFPSGNATFGDGKINFNNGEVWSKLDLSPLYTSSLDNAVVQVVQNGTTTLGFVDQAGNTTTGRWTTPTSLVDNGRNRTGTVNNGRIVWSDGEVWSKALTFFGTQSGSPTSKTVTITATTTAITAVDINGASSSVRLMGPNTLMGTSGPLAGIAGQRRSGKIFWNNGLVWENFDFNALNALFADLQTYPRP